MATGTIGTIEVSIKDMDIFAEAIGHVADLVAGHGEFPAIGDQEEIYCCWCNANLEYDKQHSANCAYVKAKAFLVQLGGGEQE